MQLILPQGNLGSTVHCVSVKPGSGKENSFFLNTQKPHPKNPCRSICCDSSRRILESTANPRNDPTNSPRLRFTCSLGFSFCVSKLTGEADCALRNSRLAGGFRGDRGVAPEAPPGICGPGGNACYPAVMGCRSYWERPYRSYISCEFCFSVK